MKEFIQRMAKESDIILYIVELVYENQEYVITEKNNPRHLQLKGKYVLWHKENMINCGIRLLPANWKAFAWIDADLEFTNPHWAMDTLKILNGARDIVQIFDHADDMDSDQTCMQKFGSLAYRVSYNLKYSTQWPNNFGHPGYAWAATRKTYEQMGGLYEYAILGSGDHHMALSLINRSSESVHGKMSDGYKKSVAELEKRCQGLRFGYVPGAVRHFFHGTKAKRKYVERWEYLIRNGYDPYKHVAKNLDGLLVPTFECPKSLLDDIIFYFGERGEDD
jgi:hypothetical protein